jgi:hypothetical protein
MAVFVLVFSTPCSQEVAEASVVGGCTEVICRGLNFLFHTPSFSRVREGQDAVGIFCRSSTEMKERNRGRMGLHVNT